jgi:hypothetical protein
MTSYSQEYSVYSFLLAAVSTPGQDGGCKYEEIPMTSYRIEDAPFRLVCKVLKQLRLVKESDDM